jgi:tetratricopeptide (TPR) repeat protein
VKKETLVTALVFLCVGFIAGFVYKAQADRSAGEAAAAPDASAARAAASSASGTSGAVLPPGHPPIDTDAAVQALEQQVAANPEEPGPTINLANYLFNQGEFEQAIRWYQKAVDLDPRNVNVSTDLGTCYFNVGRASDAIRQFRHSLTIQPRHQPTLFNMVVVNLEGTHDYKAARQAWEALHRLNPNYPNLDQLKQRLDQVSGKS